MIQKLNVIDINSDNANDQFRYRGTYLHGVLEFEIGYDIFAFDRETNFKVGATKVIIESTGRRATFFLWQDDMMNKKGLYDSRGYLVYDNDPSYDFCRKNFESKEEMI